MVKGNLILPEVQIENESTETVKGKQYCIACLNYFCFTAKTQIQNITKYLTYTNKITYI